MTSNLHLRPGSLESLVLCNAQCTHSRRLLPCMKSFIGSFTTFTRSPPTAWQADLALYHVFSSRKTLMHVPVSMLSTHP